MTKDEEKIPRIIHYCWFGGKEKPKLVTKCLNSWKRHLVNYQIVEWNESNFDINSNLFVKEAYEAGKFAFVSDYVRVLALYNYGGIYLDTDVEVFKSFDNLLHHPSFWGFEQESYIATSTIGSKKNNKLIKIFLDTYKNKRFINEDGKYNDLTNVRVITEILTNLGLRTNGEYQEIKGLGVFYPQTYFSPYDYINCQKLISEQTYTLHYFHKSWLPINTRVKTGIKIVLSKIIGGSNIMRLRKILLK
ncbi:glycosyltransferase family 32 protein [Neobacillus vireti]|uniref:glycosyltransferase family 32 protein n=1 Tax=Neobacillus vireti TaxID=220686 RepID=UPI003000C88B